MDDAALRTSARRKNTSCRPARSCATFRRPKRPYSQNYEVYLVSSGLRSALSEECHGIEQTSSQPTAQRRYFGHLVGYPIQDRIVRVSGNRK
jgi:hypothetical protein